MQKRTFLTSVVPQSIDSPVTITGLIIINATDKDCVVATDNGDVFPCPALVISTWSVPPTLRVQAKLIATPTNGKACNVIVTDAATLNSTSQLATLSGSGGSGASVTGDIIWSAANTRTNALLADGTHYNSVSDASLAALYASIGILYGGTGPSDFAVPDFRGRSPVAIGPHVDVASLGLNDGGAVANRRPKHKHTVVNATYSAALSANNMAKDSIRAVAGTVAVQGTSTGDGNYFGNSGFYSLPISVGLGASATVGPQTGAELLDSAGYFVLNAFIAK